MLVAGVAGGGLAWLATHSIPASIVAADGFIVTNLKWLGWPDPPAALASSASNHRIAVTGIVLLVLGLGAYGSKWIEKRWLRRVAAPAVGFIERHFHHMPINTAANVIPSLEMEVTRAWQRPQIQIQRIVEDFDPQNCAKTIRLEIYNPGDSRLEGIEARVVEAKGPFEPHIGLPFLLTTKERLDRNRLLGESIKPGPFGIGGYEKKQIEVFRAHSPDALEGTLVGQDGNISFIMTDQQLAVEISGSQKPFRIVISIDMTEDGVWSTGLIVQSVGEAHGGLRP